VTRVVCGILAFSVFFAIPFTEMPFGRGEGREATPAENFRVPDGFRVERIRSAQEDEGSWISMCFDPNGRLILARDRLGILRLTLPTETAPAKVEVVDDTLKHCRGVLFAHGHLWAQATNSKGFYRLSDTTGDDQLDRVTRIKPIAYTSRYGHGGNQLKLGPDGAIWLVVGNDVGLIEGTSADSPYRDPRDDHLIPYPRDHVEEVRVGRMYRFDPRTDEWLCFAGGFRNQVDIAFDREGEMFTFDADMEWDIGTPWYRPVRVNHVISGGEYGWRWETGKWPAYLPDSLPTTIDYGLGSPTGLEFGTKSSFPSAYRESLFLGEWQNGRILRTILTPKGSSFSGTIESFVEGGPLNVADLCFGPDGALWFITGGRQSQSGLYRVSWVGKKEPIPPGKDLEVELGAIEQRKLRRRLEAFHRGSVDGAVDASWPHLDSDDPWLRFAARIAVERQPVKSWRERAFRETKATGSLTALLALARVGAKSDQARIVQEVLRRAGKSLERTDLLTALRTLQLTFARQGKPTKELAALTVASLDPLFPHTSAPVNRELATLLVYLDAPRIVERCARHLSSSEGQEEQIFFAKLVSRVTSGWDVASRRLLLSWFAKAPRFRGGRFLKKGIDKMRTDFLASLSADDRAALEEELASLQRALAGGEAATVKPRPFVRKWTVDELRPALADLEKAEKRSSFAAGKRAFHAAGCARCHRFGDEGTAIGPDLTNVGRRFDARTLLEAIIEPSKVVDEKYRPVTYVLADASVVTGLASGVSGKELTIQTHLFEGKSVKVARAKIVRSTPSPTSPMPTGLIDVLERREILDLITFLRGDIVP